ncbi:DUF6241 domain-containing protein [Halalkalibacter lacteus]|uniref:DUF6241 domain-containing protein n=1 Tax=Halalkalibacter lacteus TaxID=3090663 RepID=UPI002FCBAFA2
MKKTNILSIVVFVAVAIGLFVYNVLSIEEEVVIEESVEEVEPEIEEEGEIVEQSEEVNDTPTEEIAGSLFPEDMSEHEVKENIHAMSHSKVRAEAKWSFMLLTKQRVENLIKVIEMNDYEHADLYLDILNSWAVGDFSRADADHNAVWELQGGTVGRATGVLSQEEERLYLESNNVDRETILQLMSDFE